MRLRYKNGYIVELNLDDVRDFKAILNIEKYSEFLLGYNGDKKEVIKAFAFINNINEVYLRYMKVPSHNNQGFKEYITITLELIGNYFGLGYDI